MELQRRDWEWKDREKQAKKHSWKSEGDATLFRGTLCVYLTQEREDLQRTFAS